MWKAFLLAAAVSAVVVGVECLAVERLVLNQKVEAPKGSVFNPASYGAAKTKQKEFTIPEWAPWSLLSGGAITILYTLTTGKQE